MPRFGLLFLAMTPGVFSGICAVLLAFPLYRFYTPGPKGPPSALYWAEGFGLASGLAAVGLYFVRQRFLSWNRGFQLTAVCIAWAVHMAAFAVLVYSIT
jgi:hypothetical protein